MSALADAWTRGDAGGPGQLRRGGAGEPLAQRRTGRWRTCDALDGTTLHMEREADGCALNSHQLTVTILSSCFILKGLIRTIKYALSETGNSAGLVFGNGLCMQHHLNPL